MNQRPLHENTRFIEQTFFEQIKALTLEQEKSFERQHSDLWL